MEAKRIQKLIRGNNHFYEYIFSKTLNLDLTNAKNNYGIMEFHIENK